MKKKFAAFGLLLVMVISNHCMAFAKIGDMGFFGGISEGTKLPKTTELLLEQTNTRRNTNQVYTMPYKEMIFLSGTPTEFEGILAVRPRGEPTDTEDVGTYRVTYTVTESDTTNPQATIERTLEFTVNWRRVDKQIIKDYTVRSWTETINVGGTEYTLDSQQSHYDISFLEDHTPGVTYSKGNISSRSRYTFGDAGQSVVLETSGSIYGYYCAWASTETHRIDASVYTDSWQMQYQIRPSVSVNKVLQYTKNEPTAISFEGNYQEVLQNRSGLEYDIFVKPRQFYNLTDGGKVNLPSVNSFEQLIAPDVTFLKGNYAEEDIRKLFSMQILEGDAKQYIPAQAITRGQYIEALVRAIKLPVEAPVATTTRSARRQPINIVFPDVQPDNPRYSYIMAAYKAGLAIGRENGHFFTDAPLERQEALTILVRTLGLENLGLDPTPMTSFTDDASIASWAKKEIYAANRLGLIRGDNDGNIRPTDYVSKAEAAGFINLLVDYMRTGLQLDYTEHIVPYTY